MSEKSTLVLHQRDYSWMHREQGHTPLKFLFQS